MPARAASDWFAHRHWARRGEKAEAEELGFECAEVVEAVGIDPDRYGCVLWPTGRDAAAKFGRRAKRLSHRLTEIRLDIDEIDQFELCTRVFLRSCPRFYLAFRSSQDVASAKTGHFRQRKLGPRRIFHFGELIAGVRQEPLLHLFERHISQPMIKQ